MLVLHAARVHSNIISCIMYVANAATKRVKARILYRTHPHVFRAAVKAYYGWRKDTVNCYCRASIV